MEYKGKNGNLYENYSLLNYNTFRLDVAANYFFEYSTVAGLVDFFEQNNIDIPVLHIGSGSNLLFKNDFNGLVLHSKIKTIECLEQDTNTVLVRVGSGVEWDQFVDYAVNKGWYGVENLSYIPGEVGASAVQNIGAYGVEVKDVIEFVDTITADGKERRFSVEECEYGYRSSYFKRPENRNLIVTHVAFRLKLSESFVVDYGSLKKELKHYPELTLPVLRQVIIDVRQSKLPDPSVLGNAGSFFMNPVVTAEKFAALKSKYPDISFYALEDGTYKIPAAWLIDYCGWKGKGIGDAMVFDKQALVIVNKGNATGKDIVALSDAVRASVRKEFAIEIYPEVNFVSE